MAKKTKNKKVTSGQMVELHYVGTLEDGTEFDSSRTRNETISVEVGSGQLITGFDNALTGMKLGEVKNITLKPEEAYGDVNPEAFDVVSLNVFPEGFEPIVGNMVQGTSPNGQPVVAKIDSVDDDNITLNFNHPLAGKTLNFEIELVNIQEGGE